MFELLDIAGAYKSNNKIMIVEKYCDIDTNENIYILYIDEEGDIIEYKWTEENATDINKLLIFLKTEGGSYYDEINEILYGPKIKKISRDNSYEISHYEKGFRNKFHNMCFDEIETTEKSLAVILNEYYGTIKYK